MHVGYIELKGQKALLEVSQVRVHVYIILGISSGKMYFGHRLTKIAMEYLTFL